MSSPRATHGANPDRWTLPARERLGNLDQVSSVHESVVHNGPSSGSRAIDIRPMGGIDLRILPDRGCDIGAAWFRGVPLAWISPVGERAPFAPPAGEEWLDGFGGGLLTTCGLRNVGPASEGVGLHGSISHQRARIVSIDRSRQGDTALTTVCALIRDASHARWQLELERKITTASGSGDVEVVDITRNLGANPEACPILYHVNIGAPLWDQGAQLLIPGSRQVTTDRGDRASPDEWAFPPDPQTTGERGYEHVVRADDDGWAEARVVNLRLGLEFVLRWETTTLARFHQWVQPSPFVYALGLEPTNCSVFGREHDRLDGCLPFIGPQEERITRLSLHARPITDSRDPHAEKSAVQQRTS
jgi:hypothetical protein